jgi:hypothetical protein
MGRNFIRITYAMINYIITLTPTEYLALGYVAESQQDWLT